MRLQRGALLLVGVLVLVWAPSAHANRESDSLRKRAADELYNLDRDAAIGTYREAIAADPQDAGAHRGLATALWLSITFRRGNMTVDDYLGRVTRPTTPPQPPPPETAAAFRDALDHSLALARRRLDANPRDTDAHYQVGLAAGLRASYSATVDGSLLGAFRAAREAYESHERVIALDATRKDAALIVGIYRYVVATLMLPLRLAAYVAGFGGGKEKGLQLVEEAAAYPGDSQTDARFALVLLYNRERRYDDALKQLAILRDRYPRNRLVWLETGATNLRAGHARDAERVLDEGMRRFGGDTRPRMFGENALWYYKRGAVRAVLGRDAQARQDLAMSLSLEGRDWVHGRARIETAKLDIKAGDRAAAQKELRAAVTLCESDNDAVWAGEARRLLQ